MRPAPALPVPRFSRLFKWLRPLCSFGAIHAASLLIPLFAFPLLGRVLGPDNFGLLMYMCLFPPLVALCVNWGFPLYAPRLVARNRQERDFLIRILGSVTSAKLMLGVGCLVCALFLLPFVPHVMDWPGAFVLAILSGITRGLSPLWFYQGTGQRLKELVVWEVGASVLALILVFAFIRASADWPRYFFISFMCRGGASLWLSFRLWLKYPFRLSLTLAWPALVQSHILFIGMFFSNAWHYIFQLVLGYLLTSGEIGMLVAISKMTRALISLANPVTEALFPEICILAQGSPAQAARILRVSLGCSLLLFSLAAGLGIILAPEIVGLALGAHYAAAIPILRIMLLAVPVAVCSQALANQVLVPFGKDALVTGLRATATLFCIALAILLAHWQGLMGAAFVPLVMECLLCAAFAGPALRETRLRRPERAAGQKL